MKINIKTVADNPIEVIKDKSNYLRGTINESILDELTGSFRPDDQTLIKFHGSYQQSDRDFEDERKKQKLEPLYSFMIRIRVPGGVVTTEQWLAIDRISNEYANDTIKITTRQSFQLHGVFKRNLRTAIHQVNDTLLDTLAACGDVNRNVMSAANPYLSEIHNEVTELAKAVSLHLSPKTKAYHEIWLGDKQIVTAPEEEEPIYGKLYLPRKFKIAFAVPPQNDTDVFANDLGFIAIIENGKLKGFNVTAGGGMGITFGINTTYPRLGDVLGYIPKNKTVRVAEAILIVQRDNGNREDRKNARLKYTIDRLGLDSFVNLVEKQSGIKFEKAKDFKFVSNGDNFEWIKDEKGKSHLTVFVEGGRVRDDDKLKMKTALREIANIHKDVFILTGNQNFTIANIDDKQKIKISKILSDYKIHNAHSQLRLNSIACAALPLCPLAFAEAERYLPSLVDKLDIILKVHKLENEPITIRMTGCPNGCARPYMSEIGLVGRAPGKYNLYLGGAFEGTRLNKLYAELLSEDEILKMLNSLLKDFAKDRKKGEHFSEFLIRKEYIKPTIQGKDFHNNVVNHGAGDFQI
jgi:sulfite reductase (NADPH) hemoprotein beta-component